MNNILAKVQRTMNVIERQEISKLFCNKIKCEKELERERKKYWTKYIDRKKSNAIISYEQRNDANETYKRMVQLRRQLTRLEELLAEIRCRT